MSPLSAWPATVPTEALSLTRQPDPVPHLWLVPVFIWVLNIDSGFHFPLLKGTWARAPLKPLTHHTTIPMFYVLPPSAPFCSAPPPPCPSCGQHLSQTQTHLPHTDLTFCPRDFFSLHRHGLPMPLLSPHSLPHLSVGTVTITVVLGTCSEPPLHQAVLPQLTLSCTASRPGSRTSPRFEG